MADKNKKVLVVGIAGALTEATKGSILELLKSEKGASIIEGAEIENEIESLIKERNILEALKNDNVKVIGELNGSIEQLTSDLNESNQLNLELKKDIDLLKAKVKSGDDHITQLSAEMADLSAELDSVQKTAEAGYVTVKSGKKTYRVLGKKFSYQNVEYTAEQLVKNSKLVDELVGIGSGFLIEVKGETK